MPWYQTMAYAFVLKGRPLQAPKGIGLLFARAAPASFPGLEFALELRGEGVPALRLSVHATDLDGKPIPSLSEPFLIPLQPEHLARERFSVDMSTWVCPAFGHYQVRVAAADDPSGRQALVIPYEVRQQ